MMDQLEKDFHSLNLHSKTRTRMMAREKMVKMQEMSKRMNKSKKKLKEEGNKAKELKNLKMIIMPLGRFLMLPGLFTLKSLRRIRGK